MRAVRVALSGVFQAFKKETHLKLHLIISLIVVNMGFLLHISKTDWLFLLLAIALVISLEMINSVIEKLCDIIKPEQDPKIKYIKDVAAGAVLIACVFAMIVGILVFLPYLKSIW